LDGQFPRICLSPIHVHGCDYVWSQGAMNTMCLAVWLCVESGVPWIKCSDLGCCIQTIRMDWAVRCSGFGCFLQFMDELWCPFMISVHRCVLCNSSWNTFVPFGCSGDKAILLLSSKYNLVEMLNLLGHSLVQSFQGSEALFAVSSPLANLTCLWWLLKCKLAWVQLPSGSPWSKEPSTSLRLWILWTVSLWSLDNRRSRNTLNWKFCNDSSNPQLQWSP
jgi:hypothetical protein